MRRWPLLAVLVVLIGGGVAAYHHWWGAPVNPGQGTPWTVLQDLELQHRGDSDHDRPLLVTHPEGSAYEALGLPTDDPALPRTWILLNERAIDGGAGPLKSLPANARFRVDCAYVEDLLAHHTVDAPARSLLQRHCVH